MTEPDVGVASERVYNITSIDLPGTNWAVWNARRELIMHRQFETPQELPALREWVGEDRLARERFTLAEFTDEKWDELQAAIRDGGPTDALTIIPEHFNPAAAQERQP